jgi:hypothetical protein
VRPDQEWECTIQRPDGAREIKVVRLEQTFLTQAAAEVRALRDVAGVGPRDQVPDGYRCTFSRFLREVSP